MRYYNIFIVLAILSVLLMTINRNYNYLINDWYISGVYVLIWVFLFLYTVSKVPKKKKGLKEYLPSILAFLVVLLNVLDVLRRHVMC